MTEFERIIGDAPIEEVIQAYIPLKKTGKTLSACCPFHNEKTASFHVYTDSKSYHCFGCKANGDAVDFLTGYLGIPPFEALKAVASMTGLPPPQEFKKNDKALAREDALTSLWNACEIANHDLGKRLDQVGWRIREYDASMLESRAGTLGSLLDEVKSAGLAQIVQNGSLSRAFFPPLAKAWVLAGGKPGNDQVTGFVVFEETAEGKLQVAQRMQPQDGAASLISNRNNLAKRLESQPVLLTENPLRALQCNRKITALCPAAPVWRSHDVRAAKNAYPSGTFVLDTKHVSDASICAWLELLGPRAIDLLCLPDPTGETMPALSYYSWRIAEDYQHTSQRNGDSATVVARAHALLAALSRAPENALIVARSLQDRGVPVAVDISVPRYEAPEPKQVRRSTPSKAAEELRAENASAHMLEIALLHLPYVDPDLWNTIPVNQFGPHAPIAQAMTVYLTDPASARADVNKSHAAFWSFTHHLIGTNPIPSRLIRFWEDRLAANPTYWQKMPSLSSYDGKCQKEEISTGLRYFLRKIDNEHRMDLARAAQIDIEAEEQLRASYTNPGQRP